MQINPGAYKDAFASLLTEDLHKSLLEMRFPLNIIKSLYRIIAAETLTLSTLVGREIASVDWNLQWTKPTIGDLSKYEQSLLGYRRWNPNWLVLANRHLESLENFGRVEWMGVSCEHKSGTEMDSLRSVQRVLQDDFKLAVSQLQWTGERIERNIELINLLRNAKEAEMARVMTGAVIFLSVVGSIFIPFATVASILNMNGDYAPGGPLFWVFWAVALPLILLISLAFFIFSGSLQTLYRTR